MMGGEIYAESDGKSGTSVTFTTGTKKSVVIPSQEANINKLHTAREARILLAEDNSINALVLTKILEKMGHSVIAVTNGIDAVEAARKEPFDLILLDLHMPIMNGIEAMKMLRDEHQEKCPPIIAVTANALKGDRENCLAAGMDEYISKPVKREVIIKMLDQFVI